MTEEVQTPEVETTEQPSTVLGGEQQEQETTETTAPAGAPESIDGYEVQVEGFDFDEFKAIEENQAFLERAREAGLDNKSLNFMLGEYNQLIPQLVQANAALDNESAVKEMTEVWGGEAQQNFGFASSAANNLIANGVLTAEEVNDPSFGNNPQVLKMAAYFGQQLNEDMPPSNTQQSGGIDIQSLMSSEAYLNESHPDHKRVFGQVERFYQKQYK